MEKCIGCQSHRCFVLLCCLCIAFLTTTLITIFQVNHNRSSRFLSVAETNENPSLFFTKGFMLSLKERHLELFRNVILNILYTPTDAKVQIFGDRLVRFSYILQSTKLTDLNLCSQMVQYFLCWDKGV